jgi:hypothetical protein
MTVVNVPAEVVVILRSALLSEMGVPAGQLEQASLDHGKEHRPESFLKPLAALDEYRAVLDVIGWEEPQTQEPASFDLDTYRSEIARAMLTRLDVEWDYMQVDPALKGSERQRENATGNAQIIEEFLYAHGLAGGE